MEKLENIGIIIKERRKLLGITQPDLADISGISLRSLKAIETGKGNPTLSQLQNILNSIGLKIKIVTVNENS
ncbi:MAG: helix-turn-helix domain-containing protein [Ignavibacteria bacterium]|jgi:transcriptional regulator with XRE-family HTH domain|nr:helix-turn-helix domain-containing protein [Ignavibacteria bacterium]